MILVKSQRTNTKKCKIRKFELDHSFGLADGLRFVNDDEIPANSLYKLATHNLELINKRLERARLVARAIECSFNRASDELLTSEHTIPIVKGKTKGRFVPVVPESKKFDKVGIFIH